MGRVPGQATPYERHAHASVISVLTDRSALLFRGESDAIVFDLQPAQFAEDISKP